MKFAPALLFLLLGAMAGNAEVDYTFTDTQYFNETDLELGPLSTLSFTLVLPSYITDASGFVSLTPENSTSQAGGYGVFSNMFYNNDRLTVVTSSYGLTLDTNLGALSQDGYSTDPGPCLGCYATLTVTDQPVAAPETASWGLLLLLLVALVPVLLRSGHPLRRGAPPLNRA